MTKANHAPDRRSTRQQQQARQEAQPRTEPALLGAGHSNSKRSAAGVQLELGPFRQLADAGYVNDLLPVVPKSAAARTDKPLPMYRRQDGKRGLRIEDLGKIPSHVVVTDSGPAIAGLARFLEFDATVSSEMTLGRLAQFHAMAHQHGVTLGVGLRGGEFVAIDVDPDHVEGARVAFPVLQSVMERAGYRTGAPGSVHYLTVMRTSEPWPTGFLRFEHPEHPEWGQVLIEIIGKGRHFMMQGEHKNGGTYTWHPLKPGGPTALTAGAAGLLMVKAGDRDRMITEISSAYADKGWKLVKQRTRTKLYGREPDQPPPVESLLAPAAAAENVKALLTYIGNTDEDDRSYEEWIELGLMISGATGASEEGRELWHSLSSQSSKYDPDLTEAKWPTLTSRYLGWRQLIKLARAENPAVDFAAIPEIGPTVISPPDRSDDALALSFVDHQGTNLRYVAAWGRWLRWDGHVWMMDDTLWVRELVRRECRVIADETFVGIASARAVSCVERLAQADRRVAATVEQWDRDPWLLNTPGGVVDLHTGKRRAGRPEDYCTKLTEVAPDADIPIPLFLSFLKKVTDDDEELQRYLQRLFGYALTGSTREQMLAFMHGAGGNGKSTLLTLMTWLLGGYATVAPMATFLEGGDRHPTELAFLRGARLVTAVEVEQGQRWAEAKIKTLTGGERIAARFMRQDFFYYEPQFTLIIAGNHRPGLHGVDEAMRRRLHLIPFTVTIKTPDDELPAKLRGEGPGILAWAIDGCLAWQEYGLQPPQAVVAATREYLTSEDVIGRWLAECCRIEPDGFALSASLWASWQAWATKEGVPVGTSKALTTALKDRGYREARQGGTGSRGLRGLTVLAVPASDMTSAGCWPLE